MTVVTPARVRAEPNVTPMIDVMLVLLIIFMVVVPVLTNGPVATPPAARNLRAQPDEPDDIVLSIDAHGALFLDKRPIARADLESRLTSLYASRHVNRTLYVTADRGLRFGAVQEALDIAGRSGVRVVGMVGERPANGGPLTPTP